MKYIEHLNFRTTNAKILRSFGHVYKDLRKILKAKKDEYLKIEGKLF